MAVTSSNALFLRHAVRMGISVCLTSIAASSVAQDYPTRPIRVVVPLAAGGGTDIAARVTGQKLTERWGQQAVVDNRAGGAGNIGTRLVVTTPADEYTLLVTSPAPIVVSQWLFAKLPFDPVKDLVPVT